MFYYPKNKYLIVRPIEAYIFLFIFHAFCTGFIWPIYRRNYVFFANHLHVWTDFGLRIKPKKITSLLMNCPNSHAPTPVLSLKIFGQKKSTFRQRNHSHWGKSMSRFPLELNLGQRRQDLVLIPLARQYKYHKHHRRALSSDYSRYRSLRNNDMHSNFHLAHTFRHYRAVNRCW
jgi:hypothetical protein